MCVSVCLFVSLSLSHCVRGRQAVFDAVNAPDVAAARLAARVDEPVLRLGPAPGASSVPLAAPRPVPVSMTVPATSPTLDGRVAMLTARIDRIEARLDRLTTEQWRANTQLLVRWAQCAAYKHMRPRLTSASGVGGVAGCAAGRGAVTHLADCAGALVAAVKNTAFLPLSAPLPSLVPCSCPKRYMCLCACGVCGH
jgi:hypothetical protein